MIQKIKAEIERRKNNPHITFHARNELIELLSFIESLEEEEPHHTKSNELFDKCVANCDPATMKEVSDNVDKMLEQKPADWSEEDGKKVPMWRYANENLRGSFLIWGSHGITIESKIYFGDKYIPCDELYNLPEED